MFEPLTSPNYPRAPIIEAVIQLRVSADVEPRLQEKVAHKLKSDYPHSQTLHAFEVALDNTGGNVAVAQSADGFRLANDDQTEVVIINARGITAARLAPYPGWAALRARTEAAWRVWKALTPSHPFERIGIRFINRIDVPVDGAPELRLEDYLHFHPVVPMITPVPMLGYMLQAVLPTFDPLWTATLTSTMLQPPPVPGHNSLLLDIDVSRTKDIPLNDTLLWPIIDQARIVKNDLFERCITPATRKLFAA